MEEFLGAHKTKDSRFEKKKEQVMNLEINMRNIKNMVLGLGASLTSNLIFTYFFLIFSAISSFSKNFAEEVGKVYDKSCPFRLIALQISDAFTSVQETLREMVN